jgi:cell division protein ZapA
MVLAALSIAEELFEARHNVNHSVENEDRLMESINHSLEKLLEELE